MSPTSPPSPAPPTDDWSDVDLIARHISPDGALTLRVHRTVELDGTSLISLGFEQSGWHAHASQEEALAVVEAVLTDQMVIITTKLPHETEHSLMLSIELEVDHYNPQDVMAFRLWSGRTLSWEALIDRAESFVGLEMLVSSVLKN